VADELSVGPGGAGLFDGRGRVAEVAAGPREQAAELARDEIEIVALRQPLGAFQELVGAIANEDKFAEEREHRAGQVDAGEPLGVVGKLFKGRFFDVAGAVTAGVVSCLPGCGHDQLFFRPGKPRPRGNVRAAWVIGAVLPR
jgi:hypothetical protein